VQTCFGIKIEEIKDKSVCFSIYDVTFGLYLVSIAFKIHVFVLPKNTGKHAADDPMRTLNMIFEHLMWNGLEFQG
jgi:hypothetical protein